MVFSWLSYPERLINSTISSFIAIKASDQPVSELPAVNNELDPVHVLLPFKYVRTNCFCASLLRM